MIYDVDIPGKFGTIASKVSEVFKNRETDQFEVFFDVGRYLEVDRRLNEKMQAKATAKSNRFPLIWLPITYDIVSDKNGLTRVSNLELIIAVPTDKDSSTPKRLNTTFRNRLIPIYLELLNQIEQSGFFEIGLNIQHRRKDQPYWDGKDGAQMANLFNEYIDAIQIKGIELNINEPTC